MGPLTPIIGLRRLALAAGLRHNAEIGQPGLCFSAYGHTFGINHLAVPIPYHHSNLQLEEMIYGSRQSARRRQRPELLQLLVGGFSGRRADHDQPVTCNSLTA